MRLSLNQKATLQSLSTTVPTFPHEITLCNSDRAGNIVDEFKVGKLEISDHHPIFVETVHGVIGTFNLWCSSAPISPVKLPEGKTGIFRLHNVEDRNLQIDLLAEYIIDMFKAGLGALMLQEIPDVTGVYFERLCTKLSELHEQDSSLDLGLLGLRESYRAPSRNATSTHDFGCGILVNSKCFKLGTGDVPAVLKGRGFIYSLASEETETPLFLHNIHGNYVDSPELASYIKKTATGNHIVGGDLNIPVTDKEAIATMASLPGFSSLPPAVHSGIMERNKTIDGLYMSELNEPFYMGDKYNLIPASHSPLSNRLSVFANNTTSSSSNACSSTDVPDCSGSGLKK